MRKRSGWSWADATPRKRADFIRNSLPGCGISELRKLFQLTDEGVRKILDGDDWRPEYEVRQR